MRRFAFLAGQCIGPRFRQAHGPCGRPDLPVGHHFDLGRPEQFGKPAGRIKPKPDLDGAGFIFRTTGELNDPGQYPVGAGALPNSRAVSIGETPESFALNQSLLV